MTDHNSANLKLLNSQLNELKSATKNATDVTLKFSSNMVGDSNDHTNFSYKLLLTDRQSAKLCKTFTKNSSANINLSKTQLCKTVQSGGFLDRLLGPLIRVGSPLMEDVLKP